MSVPAVSMGTHGVVGISSGTTLAPPTVSGGLKRFEHVPHLQEYLGQEHFVENPLIRVQEAFFVF